MRTVGDFGFSIFSIDLLIKRLRKFTIENKMAECIQVLVSESLKQLQNSKCILHYSTAIYSSIQVIHQLWKSYQLNSQKIGTFLIGDLGGVLAGLRR